MVCAPLGAQDIDVSAVTQGSASISSSGELTTIQASDGAVIEYQRFGVAESATVRFVQPDAGSRVLNRVVGADPSQILGRLEANGIVYLVNPAGVVFGPNAVVDVAGLYAAAGQISNEDFLAHEDRFRALTGVVANHGVIRAERFVHLMGTSVTNAGSIVATDGVVSLSSGEDVFLREGSDGFLLRVGSTGELPLSSGVAIENDGTIEADDVFFTAGDLYSLAIASDGDVSARDRVRMVGDGNVSVRGVISAVRDGVGGTVAIGGPSVVLDGAVIDVSGADGGGGIEIGGGPRSVLGFGGEEPRSTIRLFVDEATTLRADAVSNGRGGRIILWSEAATYFAGSISATGGAVSGDGGFVEVSSRGWLGFSGVVNTTAVNGQGGTLLLDPEHIEVATGGPLALTDVDAFLDAGSDPAVSRIDPATLDAAGTTVTLEARDTITITDAVTLSTDGAGLIARAGGSITVDAAISTRGGDVTLVANDSTSGNATGAGQIDVNAAITTDAGGVTPGDITLSVDGGAGVVSIGADLSASGEIRIAGPAILGGGAIGSTRRIASGAAVVFEGTVDGARRLFVLAPTGVTTFASDVGSVERLTGLLTDVGGGTVLGGDVTAGSAGIELRDPVTLTGDVTLRALAGGDLRLGSTVDSDGNARALTLLTLNAAGDQVAGDGRIELGGAIGSSSPLATLRLNTSPGVAARGSIPEVATIVGESDLTIVTLGDLTVGAGEKWTVLGSLELDSQATVTIGDLSTLGNLTIDAASIVIVRRPGALVRDAADRLFLDGGVDIVAGGSFALSVAPTFAGTGADAVFATPTGSGDVFGTLAGTSFVGFGQIDVARLIGSAGSVTGRVLDLAVFSIASEAGVPTILAAAVESGWPTSPIFDPIAPTATMLGVTRVRRHGLSSWIEWSEE